MRRLIEPAFERVGFESKSTSSHMDTFLRAR